MIRLPLVTALAVVVLAAPASAQSVPGPPGASPTPTASAVPTATAGPTASAAPTASPTTSPSTSPTTSPTPVPSGSATAGPGCSGIALPGVGCLPRPGASASPTPSATATATATPEAASIATPTVTVTPKTIDAGQPAQVSGTGTPGSTVQLFAYTRPSTTYRVVRTAEIGEDGRFAFSIAPTGNTRMFARTDNEAGAAESDSVVLSVRAAVTLTVTRTGTRTLQFRGTVLPRRNGLTVRITYARGSGQVEAARTAVAADGSWQVRRTFSGTGTFDFTARTAADASNAVGVSPVRRTAVR